MLAMQVFRQGIDNIPPVTLGLLALNCLVFYNPPIPGLDFGWARDSCLNGIAIAYGSQWGRIWTACFFHLSDMHLYFNMSSLLYKGRILEGNLGSEEFGKLIAVLATSCGQYQCAASGLFDPSIPLAIFMAPSPPSPVKNTHVGGDRNTVWCSLLHCRLITGLCVVAIGSLMCVCLCIAAYRPACGGPRLLFRPCPWHAWAAARMQRRYHPVGLLSLSLRE